MKNVERVATSYVAKDLTIHERLARTRAFTDVIQCYIDRCVQWANNGHKPPVSLIDGIRLQAEFIIEEGELLFGTEVPNE